MSIKTATNDFCKTPLFEAYYNDDIEQFLKLINDGENINCHDEHGRSLISTIICNNKNDFSSNKEYFDALIANNVWIGHDNTNRGLLSVAILNQKNTYYARELLKNKIDVNSFGKFIFPVYSENSEIISYGPPIFDAVLFNRTEYIDLFFEYNFDIDICDNENRTILNYFISCAAVNDDKSIQMFKRFIDYGADMDMLDNDGANILGTIVKWKKYYLLETLFDKMSHVDINHRDVAGRTPLMSAVYNRDINIVKFLIKKGANLNAYEMNGNNALILAVISGKIDVFKLLIDSGADILSVNKNRKGESKTGNTILHELVETECIYFTNTSTHKLLYEYYEIILKKHPELLSIKNNLGKTPIDILKSKNNFCEKRRAFFDQFKSKNNSSYDKTR